jgi:hypothetical protein
VRFEDAPREVSFMQLHPMFRLALIAAGTLIAMSAVPFATAFAQSMADPEKPVTPPDSYRVVMENERVRMIEVHIRPHSKVEVDSPLNRERFLYMLSDGALILAPPGKTPYEFALHAGETAVFPAVSPTVENDTDAPVRALMVEVKEAPRAATTGRLKGKFAGKRGTRGKVAARQAGKPKVAKSAATKTKAKFAAKSRTAKSKPAASGPRPPLNLAKANAKPGKKKVTGKSRASDS